MSEKKSADQWFAEYGESHQHPANELIHWLCVPLITFSVLGLLWSLPVPEKLLEEAPLFNWSLGVMVLVTTFYVWLSPRLSAGLIFFLSLCYSGLVLFELYSPFPMGKVCAAIFVLAWIGQFIGHKIEGKKPAFLHDLVFLLIGPAWLMSKIYAKIGQRY